MLIFSKAFELKAEDSKRWKTIGQWAMGQFSVYVIAIRKTRCLFTLFDYPNPYMSQTTQANLKMRVRKLFLKKTYSIQLSS